MNRGLNGVQSALLRAGAHGAWTGTQAGQPEVGLVVLVSSAPELTQVLHDLKPLQAQVTLLVPTRLAAHPELLRAATGAGHELAGQGDPQGLSLLEASSGQPVTRWDARTVPWTALHALAAQNVSPLPFPAPRAEPGLTVEVAPETLAAQVPALRQRGYRPGPVGALPGLRRAGGQDLLAHTYEQLVEDRFVRASGVIDLSGRADGVMRVAPLQHAPPPLPLPPGTPTAELHLHSRRLVGLAARSQLGAYRAYQRSLRDVALALTERPALHAAQAVFAVTLFHAPLAQAGFTLLDLPPLKARWYGLGFRVIRLAHGTARPPSDPEPKMAWMPRAAFLERYGA